MIASSETNNTTDVVHGIRVRCSECAISMHEVATLPPAVSPDCKRKLGRTATAIPLAEPFPAPDAAEVEAHIGKLHGTPFSLVPSETKR